MTMGKETVDLSIRSRLFSLLVGSSSDVNLGLIVNRLEIGLISLIYGGIQVSISFISSFIDLIPRNSKQTYDIYRLTCSL